MSEETEETPVILNLSQAVKNLSVHRLEWETLLQWLVDERESFFADQRQAESANDVMKTAGSIATITELKQALTPDGWQ